MEQQITWLILTVVLNGLVTAIVVVWYGKRLESRLGRENFEHQTRFSRIYPKTLEVVETFNQKLHEYINKFFYFKIQVNAMARGDSSLSNRELSELEGELFTISSEMIKYLDINRIYLPPKSNLELTNIYYRLQFLDYIMSYARILSVSEEKDMSKLFEAATQRVGMDLTDIDLNDRLAVDKFSEKVDEELSRLVVRLDSHYKSLTTKPN